MTQRQWAPEERRYANMTSRAAGCGYGFRAMRRAAAVLSATLFRASDEATAHIVRREDPADAGPTLQKAAIGGGGEPTPLASSTAASGSAPAIASPAGLERRDAASKNGAAPAPPPSSRWPFRGNARKHMRTHTTTATLNRGRKRATTEDHSATAKTTSSLKIPSPQSGSVQVGQRQSGGGAGPVLHPGRRKPANRRPLFEPRIVDRRGHSSIRCRFCKKWSIEYDEERHDLARRGKAVSMMREHESICSARPRIVRVPWTPCKRLPAAIAKKIKKENEKRSKENGK